MTSQDGFIFNEYFPHKKFADDPTPPHKLHRKDGPDTSKDAAYSAIKYLNHLEYEVFIVIKAYGEDGCISDQVREAFPCLSYSSVTARYKALIDKGFIEDSGRRRPGKSGRNQRVLIATKHWKGE